MTRYLDILLWVYVTGILLLDLVIRLAGGEGSPQSVIGAGIVAVLITLREIKDLLRSQRAKPQSNALDNSQQFRAALRAAAALRHRRES